MDKHIHSESVTTNASVTHDFSPENSDIDILDNGKTVRDFIDDKIKERVSKDTEDPFYVANLDRLYLMHLRWVTNLPRVRPFFAVKCNNTPVVLKMLSALGTGFDCASKNEIDLVLSLGATPDDIIYAHTIKPLSHIKYAEAHGVSRMTFDNEEELLKVSLSHPNAKLILRIAVDDSKSILRLNTKFGASLDSVAQLLERAKKLELDVIGISFHVGSGCTDSVAFMQAIADARHAFDIGNLLGFQMNLLDIGGGFSGRDNYRVKFEEFSEVINAALDDFFPPDSGVEVIAEPGRYYVESVFTMAVNIIAKKVITDNVDENRNGEESRKMVYYINEGLHGSMNFIISDPCASKVDPYPQRAVERSEQRYVTVLWGPTCDSQDKLNGTYNLPEMHVGDWLLLDNIGAYSLTLSSDFNGFDRADVYSVVTAGAQI
ncbi:ornithine decarboxylase-like [Brachionichthys hirsutus]|uniref:ornithine decarboxylase-like n=1 Tax=Brachionichthys hirsutus TaxID=412623 RepID=UPI003604F88E